MKRKRNNKTPFPPGHGPCAPSSEPSLASPPSAQPVPPTLSPHFPLHPCHSILPLLLIWIGEPPRPRHLTGAGRCRPDDAPSPVLPSPHPRDGALSCTLPSFNPSPTLLRRCSLAVLTLPHRSPSPTPYHTGATSPPPYDGAQEMAYPADNDCSPDGVCYYGEAADDQE
ncbi:extensin-like [Hordeum vulgare subsp. vulgare]|uniref:extensin-like n=1 Tax=Hordeum vulgare subsp. vulgare TaxID=112509 RepID=UPI001D1A3941|nr:extensin-like [Hordeum vulgare subsp. vulgare]